MSETDPLIHEILAGLAATPKVLPPALFYDERGSVLFEQITRLPEYYVTRAEAQVLDTHGAEIAAALAPADERLVLIEPGCGSSTKAAAILRHRADAEFVGIDISAEALERGAAALRRLVPGIRVTSTVADFLHHLPLEVIPLGHLAAFFPGSTLGNFDRDAADAFVGRLARLVGPGGHIVLGLDRWKDPEVLRAAYDDAAGVTAEFNRNALAHLAARFGSDLDPADFEHVVVVDTNAKRVEMHLQARRALSFAIAGRRVRFARGERVRTEHCYKFDRARIAALARTAGVVPIRTWTDPEERLDVHLLRVA
jgi:L-histidine N-alpha-methyltransferase